MVNFIKKHPVCFSIFILLLILASIWGYRFHRDRADRSDSRFFPLTELSKPGQTTIKYQTGPYIGYPRCFQLAFKTEEVRQNFDNYRIFNNRRYNYFADSDKAFYSETEGKPHFIIKIYKDANLLDIKEVYMMWVVYRTSRKIDNKLIDHTFLQGFWGPRKAACYKLEPNSNYTIEVINNTPLAKFEGMAAFLVIRPNTPWLW